MYFDFIMYEKLPDDLLCKLVKKSTVWEVFHEGNYEVKSHWHYLYMSIDLFEAHRIIRPIIQKYFVNIKTVSDPEVWRAVLSYYSKNGSMYDKDMDFMK